MRKTVAIAGTLAAFFWTSGAFAQEAERFRLERTEDGYVRMDTKTGVMSICRERSGQLVCSVAADERDAYDGDVSSLRERVKELEARVSALEGAAPRAESDLPTDEEFEQTMGLMERFFRRFMGIVKDFEKEENAAPSDKPAPDRT